MKDMVKRSGSELLGHGFEVLPNALIVHGKPTKRAFEEAFRRLSLFETAQNWWWGDLANAREKTYGSLKEMAEKYDISIGTLDTYKWVASQYEVPTRVGSLSYKHHRVAAAEPNRLEWLAKAEKEGWSAAQLASEIIDSKRSNPPSLPSGKFAVILADPPWPVGSMILDKWKSPLGDKYPTMTIDEIKMKGTEVSNRAADDCSLFLWTTHTFLREAFEVIDAWGFKYHCCITWDKISGWSLCGFHRRTEFCLYAYKGKINITQTGEFIPTLISEPARTHSEKPEESYRLIRDHTPGPRLEMFARKEHEGFMPWGNQT